MVNNNASISISINNKINKIYICKTKKKYINNTGLQMVFGPKIGLFIGPNFLKNRVYIGQI